jgi:hypothetical protein
MEKNTGKSAYKYDIFISYAKEDYAWVQQNLYNPLMNFNFSVNRRPRIFLDSSELGIRQGESFIIALGTALKESWKIIPVYSPSYFQKEMTIWELTKMFQLDPTGRKGKINPVLISPEAQGDVPFWIDHVQYLDIRELNWFTKLTHNLGLHPISQALDLRLTFLDSIADTYINNTLPPIRVALSGRDEEEFSEVEVRISARNGALQGTMAAETVNGIATFSHLSFRTPADSTHLTASATGYPQAPSNTFEVYEASSRPVEEPPASTVGEDKELVAIIPEPMSAEISFFDSGKALLLDTLEKLAVYDFQGNKTCDVKLCGPRRFLQKNGSLIAAADWEGNIVLLCDDGRYHQACLHKNSAGLNVPGGCVVRQQDILVGLWNGDIYRLALDEEIKLVLSHPGGIQAFDTYNEYIYLCDLEGHFYIYQNHSAMYHEKVERYIAGIKLLKGNIIIVGESKGYQFSFQRSGIIDERLGLANISHVRPTNDTLMVIDDEGKGVRIDNQLIIKGRFYTTAGAVPLSFDNKAQYCVFAYPDGVRTLMKERRIVYTHRIGTLAVDLTASHVAVGDSREIKIYKSSYFSKLF